MPTTVTTLELNRGSLGTIDLNDQVNYAVNRGWQPRVAKRRRDVMGGYGPFEDVVENVSVRVFSSVSAEEALSKLEDLVEALEQAFAWLKGADTDAVTLAYQPIGSALGSSPQATVLGSPEDAESLLELPVNFNQLVQAWEINPVLLPLLRRGLWLGAEESASSSAADNPNILTATLATALSIASPTKITLQFASPVFLGSAGFVLVSWNAVNFLFIEAENLTGTNYSTVADATNKARGGSVKRFTPPNTNEHTAVYEFGGISPFLAERIFVFGMVRNNSASVDFLVRTTMLDKRLVSIPGEGVEIVKAGSTQPRPVFLGMLVSKQGFRKIEITCKASSISGSPTLDFDYFLLMNADDGKAMGFLADADRGGTSIDQIIDDHRALTDPNGRFYLDRTATSNNDFDLPYEGDIQVYTTGDDVYAVLMATKDAYWRVVDTSNNNVNHTLTVARRRGYLTPR